MTMKFAIEISAHRVTSLLTTFLTTTVERSRPTCSQLRKKVLQ